mmetsp:Transcript_68456/g.216656  ORF Transcript_68456/g.216656 Transcript_68456/m.216656 type:complete len:222 (-) Transcript_68456:254-919(-)
MTAGTCGPRSAASSSRRWRRPLARSSRGLRGSGSPPRGWKGSVRGWRPMGGGWSATGCVRRGPRPRPAWRSASARPSAWMPTRCRGRGAAARTSPPSHQRPGRRRRTSSPSWPWYGWPSREAAGPRRPAPGPPRRRRFELWPRKARARKGTLRAPPPWRAFWGAGRGAASPPKTPCSRPRSARSSGGSSWRTAAPSSRRPSHRRRRRRGRAGVCRPCGRSP